MILTSKRKMIVRVALIYAIKWEESVIESLIGCTGESDVKAREFAKNNVKNFNELLEVLRQQ